ncbi:hypothetical protein [Salinigranum halophilum]|jgi:hypothetical protein|uniref:hypothetical protein n=1 Tax=Salinigranum halophilum TaxID=2565931 RepID=UPI00115F1B30|nr:hypothetical protein [Salinigranum halophilum]
MTAVRRTVHARTVGVLVGCLVLCAGFARPALAHAGSLSGALRSAQAPFWLVLVTGGGVVAASFLFATLVTDHETIREVNDRRLALPVGGLRSLVPVVRGVGVGGLLVVLVVGLLGPRDPLLNLAVLTVWVGWWAGYTMSTYLVADSWPLLNPWRTLSSLLERLRGSVLGGASGTRTLPASVGAWPSVAGLLALVWLEVVSPVGERPTTLVAVVAGYTVVTLAGTALYGGAWFDRVDPIARVFRLYGLMAPLRRAGFDVPPAARASPQPRHDGGVAVGEQEGAGGRDTVEASTEPTPSTGRREDGATDATLSLPGTALVRYPGAMGRDDVAFVVALLWVTTYDGLVSTPAWNGVVRALSVVVPPLLTHLVTAVVGFGLFLSVYRVSTRFVSQTAETYVTTRFVAGWFAPALVPIAAGYHVAHFLGYFLSLAPALGTLLSAPLAAPVSVPLLSLPGWFGSLQLGFVVAGHLLAVWVAHARAFELFSGRLQPIRSQYPFVVVMVVYTMTSLWIVAQPFTAPVT